jgi:hypothetical protein
MEIIQVACHSFILFHKVLLRRGFFLRWITLRELAYITLLVGRIGYHLSCKLSECTQEYTNETFNEYQPQQHAIIIA